MSAIQEGYTFNSVAEVDFDKQDELINKLPKQKIIVEVNWIIYQSFAETDWTEKTINMVPGAGVEPAHAYAREILSLFTIYLKSYS